MNIVNLYQKQIEIIVNHGFIVFQVINPDNSCLYFIVNKFVPSFFSNVESLDFNTITGYNITNFLEINSGNDANLFMNQLNLKLASSPVLEIQFSKGMNYYKWNNAAK